MRVSLLRRTAVLLGTACAVLAPSAAYAANAESVEWTGYTFSACTSGTSAGWSCSYETYSDTCIEAAVVGQPVASCHLHMTATARIVPIVNATGRTVGCTSVSPSPATSGHVTFDSTFNEFDNGSIDSPFSIAIYDTYADADAAALEFTAIERRGDGELTTWVVNGGSAASCRRNSSHFATISAGTVDVHVA